MNVLGIDIGTTATKTVLLDSRRRVIASATIAYRQKAASVGTSEADPADWIEATRAAIAETGRHAPGALAAVQAMGLSGKMHSLVVTDAEYRPIRPAILWNDERGQLQARRLADDVPDIATLTGVRPMASFTAAKLLWLRDNEPDNFRRIARIFWAKDFVRLWLTGEYATDISDAAGSQLFDQHARIWSAPVLAYVGLDPTVLPPLLESGDSTGRLRSDIAAVLGLPVGIVVAAGGGDTAVAALGLGCVNDGDAFLSLGTGAVFGVVRNRYQPAPATGLHDFAHCVPRSWYRMAAMVNGASCLAWAASLCNEPDLAVLLDRVAARGKMPGRILFQPYLRGERTPHDDMMARGAFIGLDAGIDAVDLARAVLEGVAFSLRQSQDLLGAASTRDVPLRFIGGGARSPFWTQMIATILDRPIAVPVDADLAGAIGAARLGLIASGEPLASVGQAPRSSLIVEPDPAQVQAYGASYETFLGLYPALKGFRP